MSALLVTVLAVGAAGAAPLKNKQKGDDASLGAIDAIVADALVQGPYPGVEIAIERHGKIIADKGYGFADLERNVPVRADTIFQIGSITKSFTALAIMQLVDAGKLSLDAKIGDVLPALPQPAHDLKIRNLLNHTSGLQNYTELKDFPLHSQDPTTRDKMVAAFATKDLLFPPGTGWSYSNSGLYLLGLVIEKVSGVDYPTYLRTHVFEPFGMTSTSIPDWQTVLKRRAAGYSFDGKVFQNAQRYDWVVPFSAGAIASTAGDLIRYRHGVFASAATSQHVRDLILTLDPLADGTPLPYALGCLVLGDFEGHRKISHSGDIFGFAAHYAYYPKDDLTIVVLTNHQGASFPPSTIERKIARVMLGIPARRSADLPLTADEAKAFEGDYALALHFGAAKLGFAYADGKLAVTLGGLGGGGPTIPLRYQGNGVFLSPQNSEDSFVFARRADGKSGVVMTYYDAENPGVKLDSSN
ncbi:MAG: serine hydrolase domain-containing protein [Rhizomicrobium sp.]